MVPECNDSFQIFDSPTHKNALQAETPCIRGLTLCSEISMRMRLYVVIDHYPTNFRCKDAWCKGSRQLGSPPSETSIILKSHQQGVRAVASVSAAKYLSAAPCSCLITGGKLLTETISRCRLACILTNEDR